MTATQFDLGDIAAEQAEQIEAADSARDAGLVGEAASVLDVNYTVGTDGRIREVSVSYNVQGARVTVDLRDGTLTAASGFDSHRVHINARDGSNDAEMTLKDAFHLHASRMEGVSMEV